MSPHAVNDHFRWHFFAESKTDQPDNTNTEQLKGTRFGYGRKQRTIFHSDRTIETSQSCYSCWIEEGRTWVQSGGVVRRSAVVRFELRTPILCGGHQ